MNKTSWTYRTLFLIYPGGHYPFQYIIIGKHLISLFAALYRLGTEGDLELKGKRLKRQLTLIVLFGGGKIRPEMQNLVKSARVRTIMKQISLS